MVQRPGGQGWSSRKFGRTRLHGNQALRLCHLGENAGGPGQDVQGHGTPERLLPALHPQVVLLERGRPRGRLCQGVRRGHPLPPEKRSRGQGRRGRSRCQTRRGADRPSHLGNDHLEYLQGLDPVLPRPAAPLQPVGERRTLGDAHPPVPAHGGISLAGGPHGPCHEGGGHRGGYPDDPRLPKIRRGVDGRTGNRRSQIAERTVRRCGRYPHDRSADAGRQGPPERHVALPGPKLRQGIRRTIHQQGGQTRIRMGHFLGCFDPSDGSAHHGSLG